MNRKLKFGLLALAVAVIAGNLLSPKFFPTEIVTVSEVDGEVLINLNKWRGSGYLILAVFSEDRKNTYWELNLNYYNGGKIMLGEVPPGEAAIRQTIPEKGFPEFPTGEPLILFVALRSDFLGIIPASERAEVAFTLSASHQLNDSPNKSRLDNPLHALSRNDPRSSNH